MLRRAMIAVPVGAFLATMTFTTTALYPRRCEAGRMEVDYVYYADCSLDNAVGERDLQCSGTEVVYGERSPYFIRTYFNCEGKYLSCTSTCGFAEGSYIGCPGGSGVGDRSATLGCSVVSPMR